MRPGRTAAWPQTSAVCGAEEAGSELLCSAAVREISKLLMESKERHGGVNRHPEIKSNQLEEASWQRSGGASATNPSNGSIRPAIRPFTPGLQKLGVVGRDERKV